MSLFVLQIMNHEEGDALDVVCFYQLLSLKLKVLWQTGTMVTVLFPSS